MKVMGWGREGWWRRGEGWRWGRRRRGGGDGGGGGE